MAFHSGPESAGATVTYPQVGQTCSPFSESPISLLPQTGQEVLKPSSLLAFQRLSHFTFL